MSLISLVIPLYNEAESLPALLADIRAAAETLPHTVEVVFVDDGSTDASWATIRTLADADAGVRAIRFRRNFGKAAALQAGFGVAAGEVVLTLDADLQDDPREIPRFLDAIAGGLDVVSGWKKVRHDPLHKTFPSRVFNGLVSRVTGVKLHDHNCGFKAYRREVLAEVRLYGELHRFVPVLAASRGFRVGELVVHHRARQFGRSKFGWQRTVKGFLDLVQVRFLTRFGQRAAAPARRLRAGGPGPGGAGHDSRRPALDLRARAGGRDALLPARRPARQFGGPGVLHRAAGGTAGGAHRRGRPAVRRFRDPAMIADATTNLRRSVYWLIGVVGVGVGFGQLCGAENVYEPSRYRPTSPANHDAGRDPEITPRRQWPVARPEPTPTFSSNDRSRWATVRALVENGTYSIGRRDDPEATTGYTDTGIIFLPGYESLDKVMDPATGKFYSSKPPLLPTIVAGLYWALRTTLGWDFDTHRWPLTITLLTITNIVPFALSLFCLARLIDVFGRSDFGRVFAFAFAAGATFLTPFLVTFTNHVPAACFVTFTVYILMRPGATGSTAEAFAAGLCAGLAAAFDLPALALGGALLVPMAIARPGPAVGGFLPGLLIPLAALLYCNHAAIGSVLPAYSEFGGPWYEYAGSYWKKVSAATDARGRGLDFASEPRDVYAFHLTLGHHGWFSLTPVNFLGLAGLISLVAAAGPDVQKAWANRRVAEGPLWTPHLLAIVTVIVSAVLFAFYVWRTTNYGGGTCGPRWLMWLTPLWVLASAPSADRLGRTAGGRVFAGLLLGISAFSVSYPASNPWRNPWLMQLGEQTGYLRY